MPQTSRTIVTRRQRRVGPTIASAVRVGALLSVAASGGGSLGTLQAQPVNQPIPVELMAGGRYASVNVVTSRSLAPASRVGFFLLSTLVLDYGSDSTDDLNMQSLLFFEPVEKFRLTGGLFYGSRPGASPTVGMQYVNPGQAWFVLIAPRITVTDDPAYSVFSILRYRPRLNETLNLFTSLMALNTFDGEGHLRSYQWARFGLEAGGTQFGVSANLDEFGPDPRVVFSIGLFVRREIL